MKSSAAHCIYEKRALGSRTPQEIYAYIGRHDITPNKLEHKSIKSDIIGIRIHPSWNPEDIRYDADVAILVLSKPIDFNDVIQPVCLPSPSFNSFNISGHVGKYFEFFSFLLFGSLKIVTRGSYLNSHNYKFKKM